MTDKLFDRMTNELETEFKLLNYNLGLSSKELSVLMNVGSIDGYTVERTSMSRERYASQMEYAFEFLEHLETVHSSHVDAYYTEIRSKALFDGFGLHTEFIKSNFNR